MVRIRPGEFPLVPFEEDQRKGLNRRLARQLAARGSSLHGEHIAIGVLGQRLIHFTITDRVLHRHHAIGHLQCHRHNHCRSESVHETGDFSRVLIFHSKTVPKGLLFAPLPVLDDIKRRTRFSIVMYNLMGHMIIKM